jgi:hypothetical protein
VERAYIVNINSEPVEALLSERLRRLGYEPVVARSGSASPEPGALVFMASPFLDAFKNAERGPTVHVSADLAAVYRPILKELGLNDMGFAELFEIMYDWWFQEGRQVLGSLFRESRQVDLSALNEEKKRELMAHLEEALRLRVFRVRLMKRLSVDEFAEELKRAAESGIKLSAFGSELRRAVKTIAEVRGVYISISLRPVDENTIVVNPPEWLDVLSYRGGTAFFITGIEAGAAAREVVDAVESGRAEVVKVVADVYTFRLDEIDKAIAAAKAAYTSSVRI